MKRKYVISLSVILITSIVAACLLVWQPSPYSLELYGMQVDEDGSVLESGSIFFSGIRFKDGNEYRLKPRELRLLNINLQLPDTSGFLTYPITDSFELCYGAFVNYDISKHGVLEYFELYLGTDANWCVIVTNKDRLFVGSTEKDFDPAQIIAQVEAHLN